MKSLEFFFRKLKDPQVMGYGCLVSLPMENSSAVLVHHLHPSVYELITPREVWGQRVLYSTVYVMGMVYLACLWSSKVWCMVVLEWIGERVLSVQL